MNGVWRMLAVACFLIVTAPSAGAARQTDAALRKDIHRLLEISGRLKLADQMASMFVPTILQALDAGGGDLPPRATQVVREILEQELKVAYAPGGPMANGLAAIYARHFTADEIRGLIAFFESPLGRKITESQSVIAQDSMKLGLSWAQQQLPALQKRIEERLRAEALRKNP